MPVSTSGATRVPGGGAKGGTATARVAAELELSRLRYSKSKALGHGTFGEVYCGVLDEGCAVAVKVLRADDAVSCCQFRRELRRYAQLRCTGAVSFYGAARSSERSTPDVFVTELMPGGSLRASLDRLRAEKARLSLPLLLRIGEMIALALASIHARAYSHGDVKPSNVLLSRPLDHTMDDEDDALRAKFVDFGLSRDLLARDTDDDVHSCVVEPKGTWAYLAPEAWRGRRALREGQSALAADVYALGVMLYEMESGEVPWAGMGEWAIFGAVYHSAERPRWPQHATHHGVRAVVQNCWSHEPRNRPSAAQVAAQLGELRRTAGLLSPARSTPSVSGSDADNVTRVGGEDAKCNDALLHQLCASELLTPERCTALGSSGASSDAGSLPRVSSGTQAQGVCGGGEGHSKCNGDALLEVASIGAIEKICHPPAPVQCDGHMSDHFLLSASSAPCDPNTAPAPASPQTAHPPTEMEQTQMAPMSQALPSKHSDDGGKLAASEKFADAESSTSPSHSAIGAVFPDQQQSEPPMHDAAQAAAPNSVIGEQQQSELPMRDVAVDEASTPNTVAVNAEQKQQHDAAVAQEATPGAELATTAQVRNGELASLSSSTSSGRSVPLSTQVTNAPASPDSVPSEAFSHARRRTTANMRFVGRPRDPREAVAAIDALRPLSPLRTPAAPPVLGSTAAEAAPERTQRPREVEYAFKAQVQRNDVRGVLIALELSLHPGATSDTATVTDALRALAILCAYDDTNRVLATDAGALELGAVALATHGASSTLVCRAHCEFVVQLSNSQNECVEGALRAAGVCEGILQTLRWHARSRDVLQAGAMALAAVCRASPALGAIAATQGAAHAATRALSRAAHSLGLDAPVAVAALDALTALSASQAPSIAQTMPDIVRAVDAFGANAVDAAASAVFYAASFSPACCTQLLNDPNTVPALGRLMQRASTAPDPGRVLARSCDVVSALAAADGPRASATFQGGMLVESVLFALTCSDRVSPYDAGTALAMRALLCLRKLCELGQDMCASLHLLNALDAAAATVAARAETAEIAVQAALFTAALVSRLASGPISTSGLTNVLEMLRTLDETWLSDPQVLHAVRAATAVVENAALSRGSAPVHPLDERFHVQHVAANRSSTARGRSLFRWRRR